MEDFKFGDMYIRNYGVPFKMVFLHQNRLGDCTFGTDNGGIIHMPYKHLMLEMANGRIAKA